MSFDEPHAAIILYAQRTLAKVQRKTMPDFNVSVMNILCTKYLVDLCWMRKNDLLDYLPNKCS